MGNSSSRTAAHLLSPRVLSSALAKTVAFNGCGISASGLRMAWIRRSISKRTSLWSSMTRISTAATALAAFGIGTAAADSTTGAGCKICDDGDVATPTAPPAAADQDNDDKSNSDATDTTDTSTASHASQRIYAYMHSGCPLNRREVGRASWALLHTIAAYFPENPTKQQQQDAEQFMKLLARLYPCGYCGDTTNDEMIRNPPRTSSRKEFATWMCEIHNEVNDRLGKPEFDCSRVAERWRTGPNDGSCG
jgi:mitochondrial FAD-linked sulfhydryl oxidase